MPPLQSIDNPYAPPATVGSPAVATGSSSLYRDGGILVARNGALFPDRCVRCDDPAAGYRLKRTYYWHPPGWYLLILVNIIVYAVVAMFVRKKATFGVPLCPRHRKRRRALVASALLLPPAALAAGIVVGGELVTIGVIGAVLVAAIVGVIGSQVLSPNRIDEQFAHLKGAHADFLRHLPSLR